jgi:Cu+-exporting ATPase
MRLGSRAGCRSWASSSAPLARAVLRAAAAGRTSPGWPCGDAARRRGPRLLACSAFGDTPSPARAAIARRCARMGVRSVLVSGDNRGSRRGGRAPGPGIDEVRAEVLPGDKAR